MTSTQLTSRRRIATESSAASQSTISCRLSGREIRTLAKEPDAVAADATGIVAAEAAMTPAREALAAPARSPLRVRPSLSTDVLERESWYSVSVIAGLRLSCWAGRSRLGRAIRSSGRRRQSSVLASPAPERAARENAARRGRRCGREGGGEAPARLREDDVGAHRGAADPVRAPLPAHRARHQPRRLRALVGEPHLDEPRGRRPAPVPVDPRRACPVHPPPRPCDGVVGPRRKLRLTDERGAVEEPEAETVDERVACGADRPVEGEGPLELEAVVARWRRELRNRQAGGREAP